VNDDLERDIRNGLKALNNKFDVFIKHQEEVCKLHRKPLEEHIKDGPHFRDKLVKLGESLRISWILLLIMITGCVGGFWWLLRK